MLLNWFTATVSENNHYKQLLNAQDLKNLGIQYCTDLLAVGVLRQIADKNAPTENIFKPNLMYYWAHMEAPASQPVTPGRLQMTAWPPDKDNLVTEYIHRPLENDKFLNQNNNEDVTDINEARCLISQLKARLQDLELLVEKQKIHAQIEALNKNIDLNLDQITEQKLPAKVDLVNKEIQCDYNDELNKLSNFSKPVIKEPLRTNVNNVLDISNSNKCGFVKDINETSQNEFRSDKVENYCKLNKSRECNVSLHKDGIQENGNDCVKNEKLLPNQTTVEESFISSTQDSSSDASFRSTLTSLELPEQTESSSEFIKKDEMPTKSLTTSVPTTQVLYSIVVKKHCATPDNLHMRTTDSNISKSMDMSSTTESESKSALSPKKSASATFPPPLETILITNENVFDSTSEMSDISLVPDPQKKMLCTSSSPTSETSLPPLLSSITTTSPQEIGKTLMADNRKSPETVDESVSTTTVHSESTSTPETLPSVPEMGPPLPPPMPDLGPPPPPVPGMVPPPPPPMPGIGPPPPPPMPGMGPPPPPPMPGMGPPPPPMPGMGPPPPPMPGMGPPPPPPMPGMGPPPPPMPGMGPPPPPMPGMGPPPPPMPGMGPPPPPMPGMNPPPPPMPGAVPPPPPGTGPPPPPGPPSGPVPFPAPPIGGWNMQRATLRKTPVKPAAPMKPLYWTRILAAPPQPTCQGEPNSPLKPLWLEIDEAKLDNIDEFTDLFSRQVVKAPVKKKVEVKTKIKPVKILDSKRSQNVGILAQSLHLDFSEIENAIYNFDTSVVSLEALQQIYELRASEEELSMIKEHLKSKPNIPLDRPEGFLYDLSGIPNFAERISCFMFQAEFEDAVSTTMHKLDNLKHTCEFLMTSESLKKLFAIILTLGNYMNGGNGQRGQADGFGLEILAKLKDVKSKQSNVTLLHFIVRTYMAAAGGALAAACALPVPEPGDVTRAAAIDFNDVAAGLAALTKQLAACKDETKKVLETNTSPSSDSASGEGHKRLEVFKDKMTTFINAAEEKLKTENENLDECRAKFIATVKFYQYTPKCGKLEECEPKEFFSLWTSFCIDFKDIYKKEEQIAIKEKLKEAKKHQEERKSLTQPKKEGGLKARLQKLSSSRKS